MALIEIDASPFLSMVDLSMANCECHNQMVIVNVRPFSPSLFGCEKIVEPFQSEPNRTGQDSGLTLIPLELKLAEPKVGKLETIYPLVI